MNEEKLTEGLKDFLKTNSPQNLVEVIVELTPATQTEAAEPTSRTEKIAFRKQSFLQDLEPVAKAISNQGGEVIDSAWLNQTVKAKLSAEGIEQLSQLNQVSAIDIPRRITAD